MVNRTELCIFMINVYITFTISVQILQNLSDLFYQPISTFTSWVFYIEG